MRILLVDDEAGMISVWNRFLQPLNAEIFIASNVDTAIEEMKKVPPPDLVLLDLILPPNGHVEGVLHKGDEITQGKLLRAMLSALAKNPNSGELLQSVGTIVERLTETEERKKTGPINLA